ncbi:MAG: HlyD family efflux transporter periplasmic adaptor subunit [Verrucomicrobia bacterium]|nr:HlyD family efflux transporter periplasmic adaptor subunit [Verrucomicrobiota bacterium]
MLTRSTIAPDALDQALAELLRLRRFGGAPSEFWPALITALARLVQGRRGVLVLRDPTAPDRLRKLGEWTEDGQADRSVLAFSRCLPDLAQACAQQGHACQSLEGSLGAAPQPFALGVSLPLTGTQEQCLAVFLLGEVAEAEAREALVRLQLAADVPQAYQTQQAALQAKADVEKFASVLDVMVMVNAETRFRAAALAFCNGLADRFQCERVSLGWLGRGFVRLRAISRTERFNKQMAAVHALEVLMEEALDQDDEILWPQPTGSTAVARDHEKFAREQGVAHLVSLPLRLADQPVAGLTCERQARPFAPTEVQQLRLACDQAVRRLADLRRLDRWFGARWWETGREKCAKLVGPQHTWAKVFGLVGTAALVALFLPVYPYRIEGNHVLRSDEVSYLPAPFDGYIQAVAVRPGDELPAGGELLRLDTDQLELEEAAAIADQTRFLREAEKARAQEALAEMRIAEAQADQAKARLELARYRLSQAEVKSPFASVVIEGDLRQRIGAPVKQGDVLFKLARFDRLYVEATVNERDVHELVGRESGEIAFVSQPKLKFPVKVVRLEPAALPKEKENVFVVRCEFVAGAEPWWRPGMSGVCKIDVERRTLFWILTHRTVDFLRLLLWW